MSPTVGQAVIENAGAGVVAIALQLNVGPDRHRAKFAEVQACPLHCQAVVVQLVRNAAHMTTTQHSASKFGFQTYLSLEVHGLLSMHLTPMLALIGTFTEVQACPLHCQEALEQPLPYAAHISTTHTHNNTT
jgi:hypothetical protein